MMRIERGHDDLADVAFRDGIAGAGPDDFQDQILVDRLRRLNPVRTSR